MSEKGTPEAGLASARSEAREKVTDPVEIPDEPYAENTPLTWVFGNYDEVLVVAALLSERERELVPNDIGHIAGVSTDRATKCLNALESIGLVEETTNSSEDPKYRIDGDNEVSRHFLKIENLLLEQHYR